MIDKLKNEVEINTSCESQSNIVGCPANIEGVCELYPNKMCDCCYSDSLKY